MLIPIICYSIAVIIIAVFIVPAILYQCIKWGTVAWYKGKEFYLKHRKPDTRNLNNHNTFDKE